MYDLLIYEIDVDKKGHCVNPTALTSLKERRKCRKAVECSLTFQQLSEICFDASTEIFDIRENKGKVLEFVKQNEYEWASLDYVKGEFDRIFDDMIDGKANLSDIAVKMGRSGVSYPNSYYSDNSFIYRCENIEGVLLCLLHFFVSRKYKFAVCGHCGKRFARYDDSVLYCNRVSPLREAKKNKVPCAFAVKQEIDKFDHRRDSIRKTLENKKTSPEEEIIVEKTIDNLLVKYGEYRKRAKHNGSVDLLLEIQSFLYENPDFPPVAKGKKASKRG